MQRKYILGSTTGYIGAYQISTSLQQSFVVVLFISIQCDAEFPLDPVFEGLEYLVSKIGPKSPRAYTQKVQAQMLPTKLWFHFGPKIPSPFRCVWEASAHLAHLHHASSNLNMLSTRWRHV